jgi:outer membrane protein TolC
MFIFEFDVKMQIFIFADNSLWKVYFMKSVALLLFFSSVLCAQTQKQVLILDTLQTIARINYPQTKQFSLIRQSGIEAVRNVNTNYLPKVSLNATASYQSEVTQISLPPSMHVSIPETPKDNGKAGIEVTQLITDFGVSGTQRDIERLSSRSDSLKLEADLLKLRLHINSLFTDIAVAKETAKMLHYTRSDLETRRSALKTSVEAGTSLASVLQELDAEILSINQKFIENDARITSLCSSMSQLVGINIDTSVILQLPNPDTTLVNDVSYRPDFKMLDVQKEVIDQKIKLLVKSTRPRLSLFGNGYYGRPGLNMFNNDFHPYGIAGVSLSWPISSKFSNYHQKRSLSIAEDGFGVQENVMKLTLDIQLSRISHDIDKLRDLIVLDEQIVEIRQKVKNVATLQFENNAITTADYTSKLIAESVAMTNKKIHLIQLTMAYVEYQTTCGTIDRRNDEHQQ